MIWRVEIKEKDNVYDALGESVAKDIADLGLQSVKKVYVVQVYMLTGSLSKDQVEDIARQLLADRVTQDYSFCPAGDHSLSSNNGNVKVVEIAYNPGVMDPVEASTIKGIRDLGIDGIQSVATAKQYHIEGKISSKELNLIIEKVLCNKLIQHVVKEDVVHPDSKKTKEGFSVDVIHVDLLKATDKQLMKLSREGQLFLNLNEMQVIQKYFRKLKRDPTDCELETIAQTWSEHCNHKTFRGNISCEFKENGKIKKQEIRSLLKSTIVKATEKLNKPWCVSVFHDNAGIIRFDEKSDVCFKVETHNHPSALEPFGGANTGMGGVIRDILGTGLGAKPICSTDVFCFAPPDHSFKGLPQGTLHPKRVMKGVVSGVRDYGNKMGIPTVNGAILFDEKFVGNPLVYCGNVGIIPKGKEFKKARKGDLIVTVGGRTGRDGIHGATFSSGELTSESEVVSSGAVQIGDPIQEKKVLDCLLQARDKNLYSAITDCGAGGFSSAVGEMGAKLGARVDLEKAPLKYDGLSYMEIWISESQERMVMAVPPSHIREFLEVFANENVEATVIGEFTGTKRLELFYHGTKVCDLDMEFLHEGIQKVTKKAQWIRQKHKNPKFKCPADLTDSLLKVFSHYNVCSKEWVIRQYDHEVQGGSVVKPLVGVHCDGPSDAAVLAPKMESTKGIAVSNGINVRYGMIDPFWMAASCIDEAIRQVICVGGNPDRIALLDNFCWGNPNKPDRLGGLVRAGLGCYKTAVGYGTPFISGKDSLYNEYAQGKKSIAIPGTILISAIAIVDDIKKCVTMDLKRKGNHLYIAGMTEDEMGGSIYYDTLGFLGSDVPKVNTKKGFRIFQTLHKAVKKGLIESMHDCSEGGIGVALGEMAFAGRLGVTVLLSQVPYQGKDKRNDKILFSESNSRFVVEVSEKNKKRFEKELEDVSLGLIGRVEETPEFIVYGVNDKICVNTYIDTLKQAWQKPLKW